MADDPKPGFFINQGKIALVLSIITLLTLGYNAAKVFINQDFRIAALEEKMVAMNGNQKEVADELRNLNKSLNSLNLILREIQVKTENVK